MKRAPLLPQYTPDTAFRFYVSERCRTNPVRLEGVSFEIGSIASGSTNILEMSNACQELFEKGVYSERDQVDSALKLQRLWFVSDKHPVELFLDVSHSPYTRFVADPAGVYKHMKVTLGEGVALTRAVLYLPGESEISLFDSSTFRSHHIRSTVSGFINLENGETHIDGDLEIDMTGDRMLDEIFATVGHFTLEGYDLDAQRVRTVI
jgi:hypothetical protein